MEPTTDQTTATGGGHSGAFRNLPLLATALGVASPAWCSRSASRPTRRGRRPRRRRPPTARSSSCPSSTGATPRSASSPRSWSRRPARWHARHRGAGAERARLGTAVPGTGSALWVEVEVVVEAPATEETTDWPVSTGRGRRHPVEPWCRPAGRAPRRGERAGSGGGHGRLLARPLARPEGRGARDPGCGGTVRLVIAWSREVLADLALRERIKTDVEEGMERPNASSSCAGSWSPSRRSSASWPPTTRTSPTTTGPWRSSGRCRTRSARRWSARSTSSSA